VQSKKKALVLSGGGGRGAYHVGVIEALVEHGWMEDGKGPDIIAGTSIGAINAAALASGLTVARMKEHWLNMHTEDVHRLSNDLPPVVRPLLRFILRSVLTSEAHGGASAAHLPEDERNLSAGSLLERLGSVFRTRPFRSLLDNTPWRYTLEGWMNFARINSPEAPALLLTATDMRRGVLRIFCNRMLKDNAPDPITIDHLIASSSIPAVYPWTEIGEDKYWDGAVLANTPLGAVIDLAGGDDVEILVVMMTPWFDDPDEVHDQMDDVPSDLVQALSLTLDWSLLASYRTALKLLKNYNQLVDAAEKLERAVQQTGDESLRINSKILRRVPMPTVIAPQNFMPLEWMIDYEEANHRKLFEQGKADAERVLATMT
jgi:NTE family protein